MAFSQSTQVLHVGVNSPESECGYEDSETLGDQPGAGRKRHRNRRRRARKGNLNPEEANVCGQSPMNSSTKKCDKTKYKTEMCKNWVESDGSYCRYGDKCQFAHGSLEIKLTPEPLHDKYKSKECVQFHGTNFCPYGLRCMFQHEERSLDELRNYYYVHKLGLLEYNSEEPELYEEASEDSSGKRLPIFEFMAPAASPALK
jgi:hypothetical protein